MTKCIVTYDLVKRKDYTILWRELDRLKGHRALSSFWLFDIKGTTEELYDHLIQFIDKGDRIWVSELSTQNFQYNTMPGTKVWLDHIPTNV